MRNGEAKMTLATEEIPVVTDVSLTQRLRTYFGGNPANVDELLKEILPRLREVASRETRRERHTQELSPTELIHEVWLRNLSRATWLIRDRGHFYAIAGLAMRRVLIDLARRRLAERRSGPPQTAASTKEGDARQIMEIGLLMDQMERELSDSAHVIDMHYFAGFTFVEIAESTALTVRQVRIRWEKGMKWLKYHHGTSGS
jgi:RNA polymerase sigma factor (TIGR02999 family)